MLLLFQVLNIFSFIAVVIVNFLAVSLPLNGQTTGEIAYQYPSLFTPARFTFIIWRLIYILLTGFVVYQAQGLLKKEPKNPHLLEKVSWLFILSSLANIGWIFLWHYNRLQPALIMIGILLVSLVFIYNRLGFKHTQLNRKEYIFVYLPFSVYLAWVTISTVGNLSVLLVDIEWDGWGLSQTFWTVVALFCLLVLANLYLWGWHDRVYPAVFIWAFIGIFYQRIVLGDPAYYVIGVVALIAAVLLSHQSFMRLKRLKSLDCI